MGVCLCGCVNPDNIDKLTVWMYTVIDNKKEVVIKRMTITQCLSDLQVICSPFTSHHSVAVHYYLTSVYIIYAAATVIINLCLCSI